MFLTSNNGGCIISPDNGSKVGLKAQKLLAQVFTDIRYTKKDCEAMSVGFIEALKQQGFI